MDAGVLGELVEDVVDVVGMRRDEVLVGCGTGKTVVEHGLQGRYSELGSGSHYVVAQEAAVPGDVAEDIREHPGAICTAEPYSASVPASSVDSPAPSAVVVVAERQSYVAAPERLAVASRALTVGQALEEGAVAGQQVGGTGLQAIASPKCVRMSVRTPVVMEEEEGVPGLVVEGPAAAAACT